ncbi:sigma 54-interacting transcriptional regulator [Clostridium sp. Marseille-P3244]|uniref:sigma 54-interacting transcriptional regulator n=1 Tax=Clostridium sp. Marseille-P3244 TaxID=1871020 RepID=UPI000930F38A|nr:sigma-54-dependent transcriptional regulator [Clostridium sp. Marseille-P3244]
MAKRRDIIYEKVKELSREAVHKGQDPGVTASDVAESLQMDRGNVSKEMNLLASDGLLVKYTGRPVKFADRAAREEWEQKPEEALHTDLHMDGTGAFRDVIGQEGSLKMQIKQAKAAMLYPPHGLHTLLNGPTGTGKTMFAREMFEYAKQMNMLKQDAEFVTFNCAEYADNPQLIMSQIFGHRKGSFTGADRDKPGLVERADGGILFLDEIHRFPPEGQEMLFGLMDYGKYRRLGETEQSRKADVLIVGATTENLDAVLLKTFLRRMPVVIHLPLLKDRPLLERLEMIELFLAQEQKKISVSVRVSREVLLSLLLYDCPGNIGQIKADIQLLCARAFWEYKVGSTRRVELNRQMLPFYIEQGYYKAEESRDSLVEFLLYGEEEYIISSFADPMEIKQSSISKKYLIFHKFYSDKKDTEQELPFRDYISSMISRENEGRTFSQDALNKVIAGKVYYAVEEAVEFAQMRLKKQLSNNIKIGFALHINALVEGVDKRQDIREEKLTEIIDAHPREAKVAKLILRILEDELNITVNANEVGYTTMFLCADEEEQEVKKIGLIVLAHGDHTATSIADAANRLLDTDHCRAINMPLNEEVEAVYRKALEMSVEINEGRGVLLMVDMGSLNMFGERISEETGIEVRSVGLVSTLPVLEAIRKCTVGTTPVGEVADYLEQMMGHMLEERKQQSAEKKMMTRSAILVSCLSGMGAAKKIAEMVKVITGVEKDTPVQIRCVGIDGRDEEGKWLAGYQEQDILAVAGTADLQLESVPYISVDDIVIGNGIEQLEKIVNGSDFGRSIRNNDDRGVDERVLVTAMKELLEFLDAEKIAPAILESFRECADKLEIRDRSGKAVRYMIHVACMVERLLKKDVLPYQDTERLREERPEEFRIVSGALSPIEEMFQLKVPDTEKAYVVELLQEDRECSV